MEKEPEAKCLTVLVVDDEPGVRLVAAEMFDELGCTVIEAGDGAEALAMIEERLDIDLVFTDCKMPRMSGPELAAAATALRPDLRVVLTTGHVEPGQAGWPLVRKPYTWVDLERAVA